MGRLKCHTVTLLVFPPKIPISDQDLSKFTSNVQCNAEIYMADGILFIFKHSMSLNVWKCSVLLLCHTVTIYFSQHISYRDFIKKSKIVPKVCNKMMLMMLQGYKVML